jgi:hypothetical protein
MRGSLERVGGRDVADHWAMRAARCAAEAGTYESGRKYSERET